MINEYTLLGSTYSMHDGTEEQVDVDNCVIISVPRAFTDVCTKEIELFNSRVDELNALGLPVYLASSDSPEINSMFLGEYSERIVLPMITIKHQTAPEQLLGLFHNGYTSRATVLVKEGLATIIPEDHESVRSFDRVIEDIKALFDIK